MLANRLRKPATAHISMPKTIFSKSTWQTWAKSFPLHAAADAPRSSPFRTIRGDGTKEKPHEILIYGQIGRDWASNEGVVASEFAGILAGIPQDEKILCRIQSPGGNFYEGLAMYNLAKARGKNLDTIVDGQAASVAADFMCAGNKVRIPAAANVMIHKSWGMCIGNDDEMDAMKASLQKVDAIQVSILSKKTGKSAKAIKEAMAIESEYDGNQACEFGLCDELISETPDDPDDINARIQALAVPINSAAPKPAGNNQQTNIENTMKKSEIVALLISHGIQASETETEAELLAKLNKIPKADAPVAPVVVPAAPVVAGVSADEFRTEKRRRIRAEVLRVGENKVANDKIDVWTDRAMAGKEEDIFAEISALNAADIGGDPVGFNRIEGGTNPILAGYQGRPTPAVVNLFKDHTTPLARYEALKMDFGTLFADATAKDRKAGRDIRAENNFAGGIATNFLIMGAITKLGPKCCALKAFARDNTVDPYKPLATGVQKFNTTVQDGSDTMTNATDFTGASNDGGAAGDSTLTGPTIAVNQYTQALHLTNGQLNSGIRMADLIEAKLGSLLSKIVQIVTAPITVANFSTLAPLVINSAAFGFSDAATLQGQLQKSSIKNLMLAGPYQARLANTPGFFQTAGVVGGLEDAWKAFGWSMIGLNTEWQGADPFVQGFACNPQAIGMIAGLPLNPVEGIPGNIIQVGTAVLPGVDIAISTYLWMDANARTMRATYDIMLGASLIDASAGIIIKSQ